jgi:hypothetical protein
MLRYTDESSLPAVTDEMLQASLATTRPYTIVILKGGPGFSAPGPDRDPEVAATIWKHGKRNFALRTAGLLRVVCPVADGSEVSGVGIFDAEPAEVERIMAADPAVMAEILRYEIHPTRTFASSTLAD